MANQANVEALAELYRAWEAMPKTRCATPAAESFANFAASRGVLVISDAVLTDEACKAVWEAATMEDDGFTHGGAEYPPSQEYAFPDRMRTALAQLAKGE